MKLFIVVVKVPYESDDVIAVSDNLENATKIAENELKNNYSFDPVVVYEVQTNTILKKENKKMVWPNRMKA